MDKLFIGVMRQGKENGCYSRKRKKKKWIGAMDAPRQRRVIVHKS